MRIPKISGRRALLLGGSVYLLGALVMFSRVLALSPTRATTCPCSDSSLFAWYFEWLWVAVRDGHNPFFSTAVFHPVGTNLLANTSSMALGLVLLPITALFGPIASVNVAVIAAPVLSGLAAMWVATRWTTSSAVAWLVGALYAFSPLVLTESSGAHLMITFLAIPPLVLACFDELLFRRTRSPIKVGAVLGALIVVQFFIGTELLVLMAITIACSLVIIGIAALVMDRAACIDAVRSSLPGFGVAIAISLVILAWPALYALAGPQHYNGVIWPGRPPASNSLRSVIIPQATLPLWWDPSAPTPARASLLGPGLVFVVLFGGIFYRRDHRLVVASTMTGVLVLLGLGSSYSFAPWHYVQHVPIIENVFNDRFGALLLLPAGLALARTLENVRTTWPTRNGAVAAWSIAALCVLPFLPSWRAVPYAANRVFEPLWFQQNGSRSHQEVILQMNLTGGENFLAVQALHAMTYSINNGGPPQSFHPRQPAIVRPGAAILGQVSSASGETVLESRATPAQRLAVMAALRGWKVTKVVLPTEDAPTATANAGYPYVEARWLISVLGPATFHDGAWVWRIAPPSSR